MPFRPRGYNATNAQIVNTSQQVDAGCIKPLSQGGFNAENVDGVTVAPLNQGQEVQINRDADKLMTRLPTNSHGLVCPTPLTGDIEESVAKLVTARLWKAVVDNNWYAFFTQEELQNINDIASRHDYRTLLEIFAMPDDVDKVITVKGKQEYDMRKLEKIVQLAVLALCDQGFLLDNSGSMAVADAIQSGLEGDEIRISRLNAQKNIVKLGAFVSRLFDTDGIEVRTMTPDPKLARIKMSNLRTKEEIDEIFAHGVNAEYGTPTADALMRYFNEIIKPKLISGTMKKPYIIWLLTDGAPSPGQDVVATIRAIRAECARTKYGDRAVLISASIVGEDEHADREVTQWDKDKVGHPDMGAGAITDCISSYYKECKEITLGEGETYEPMDHNIRMFTGPIILENDALDEGGAFTIMGRLSQLTLFK